ncbi:MAG: ABC transporter permease [Candidatus Bathyarchaeota archaeon]|nr:MAG: ABC transporter permease [Candidatus Bathyarchaeota archaeon]
MNPIADGLWKALELLIRLDPEVFGIMFLSLRISGTAVILGALLAIPLGTLIALREFRGKHIIVNFVYTLMGLPPVVAGLFVYLFLSSSGPLAPLSLLFTPTAMIIAQLVMAVPIIMGITISAVKAVPPNVVDTAVSLGANRRQLVLMILSEARIGLIAAIITSFGAAISEVGAIMLVGGNIRFFTRVLTGAVVLYTRMGDFGVAIALGIILLILAFVINSFLTYIQMRE